MEQRTGTKGKKGNFRAGDMAHKGSTVQGSAFALSQNQSLHGLAQAVRERPQSHGQRSRYTPHCSAPTLGRASCRGGRKGLSCPARILRPYDLGTVLSPSVSHGVGQGEAWCAQAAPWLWRKV